MMSRSFVSAILLALPLASASAATLRGSHASMLRQHNIAVRSDFTFLRSARQVRAFAESDRLELIAGTETYQVDGASFPYARPVVKLFIDRLARQFRDATGGMLVITSLTRPTSLQPRNSSPLSVHPAGMAVDLRVPATEAERSWLESALLSLEDRGVLDVTRERRPAHYHVAVFPPYEKYAAANPLPAPPANPPAREVMVAEAANARTGSRTPVPYGRGSPPSLVLVAAMGVAAALGLATRRLVRREGVVQIVE